MNRTMEIEGMTCNHCTGSVKAALEEAGAQNVIVSLEQKIASFEGSSAEIDRFKESVESQGYDVISVQ